MRSGERALLVLALGQAEPAPVYAATVECWETARIGDPLPDCWR